MTSRIKNKLMSNINSVFGVIGTTTETRPTRISKNNTALVAWEFFVASHLQTMAQARRKKARELAIEAGVLFDSDKEPRDPGTNDTVYEDENMFITVTVKNPATRINTDILLEQLVGKVSKQVLDDAVAKATFETKPAHEFKVTLRTE